MPETDFSAFRAIALSFPGVVEGTSYGTPAFRVNGKFLARLREDGETLAIKCGFDERDFRMSADPQAFFTTDHYRGYPTVLVRLGVVSATALQEVFEAAWHRHASRALIAQWEQRPT